MHLPWCVKKCPYCDFNSHPLHGDLPAEPYIAALLRDLDEQSPLVRGRQVESIFFGGGTPSLFSGALIGNLLERFASRLDLAPDVEVTMEANPGTVERDSFRAYRDAGVNRISLGVQSFDDEALRRLGRIHDGKSVTQALASLAHAGLDNFNIDLMFGLPGQSPEEALDDVKRAIAAGPAHVSHYQLTLEPNTAFHRDPPELPDDEVCWVMQAACAEALTDAGFGQYEISAWARPGRRCAHNLNYWRYGDFLAVGAGAHGKLSDAQSGVVTRWSAPRQPRSFMGRERVFERRVLTSDDLVFEFFLNRLRLREGFSSEDFTGRTGLDWTVVSERIDVAVSKGLLACSGEQFSTTELGWRFVNDIQAMFLP